MEYVTSYGRMEEIVNILLENPKQWLGCDTETTGLDRHSCKLSLVQIATVTSTYIFDTFRITNWEVLFKKLVDSKTFNWVFHNFKFDCQFFWKVGVDFFGNKVLDTFIVASLLTAGLGDDYDLNSVCQRYIGLAVDKTEQKSDWSLRPLSEEQLAYAAKDAESTLQLGKTLLPLITNQGILEVFKLEMRAVYSFAAMEYNGMTLDLDRLNKLRPIYEEQLEQAENNFLALVPGKFTRKNLLGDTVYKGLDMKSSSQILDVLRKAGIPNPIYDKKSDDPLLADELVTSTGSNVIKLLDIGDYPILENLVGYRKASKLLDAYIYSLPELVNSTTGKLHTNFRQMVSTGRASSSSPNLQNIQRPDGNELNLRSCFVPSEGYRLIDADYSQIELRVVAEIIYDISGDETMLEEFLQGKDPYAATAALLSGMRYLDIVEIVNGEHKVLKQYKALRQNAKAVRLGYNYSMGWRKFKAYAKITYGVNFSLQEAKANRDLYFSSYPGLSVYHETFSSKDLRKVLTLAPFCRPRFFEDYPGIPSLSNHPVQGTSADIQKLAMAMMYETLHAKGYSPTQSDKIRQVCTIHDEIVAEAIPDMADETCDIQQRSMVEAANRVLKYCPVEAEAHVIANLAQK